MRVGFLSHLFYSMEKFMTTSELIALLKIEDPEGNTPVCVGNTDIHFVENLPAYYDGKLNQLIRDPKKAPYYDIVSAKRVSSGHKVKIHTLSIHDVIENNPDIPIDYTQMVEFGCGSDRALDYKKSDDEVRTETRRIEKEVHEEFEAKKNQPV